METTKKEDRGSTCLWKHLYILEDLRDLRPENLWEMIKMVTSYIERSDRRQMVLLTKAKTRYTVLGKIIYVSFRL